MNGFDESLKCSISKILVSLGYEAIDIMSLKVITEFTRNFLRYVGEEINYVTETNNQKISNLFHAKTILIDLGIDVNHISHMMYIGNCFDHIPISFIEKVQQYKNQEDPELLIARDQLGIVQYAPPIPENFHEYFHTIELSKNDLKRLEYKKKNLHTDYLKSNILKTYLSSSSITIIDFKKQKIQLGLKNANRNKRC